MSGRLANKRAIITGAATGIGQAIAAAFIAEGARVVIGDINERTGSETAKRFGDSASFVRCDVSDEQSVAALVREGVAWLGGLDVLVNNAGLQFAGVVESFEVARWDALMAVNIRGCFLTTKFAVPHLRAAGGGSIVNTASLAAKRSGPGMTAYAASKGAVMAFSATAAIELAPDKIRVNSVCPGFVDTPFNQPAITFIGGASVLDELVSKMVPLGRQAQPAEIAPLYVYLASDESAYVTAQAYSIDGGVYS